MFAANVTCKEWSPNLETKVVVKCLQRSLSSIWWSYREPEHMFSSQEVTFDRVPIWSHHWLQFRIIVMRSSWMSSIFRIVAKETCLHSHRGRFQGRGWSREQQQQCRLRSNRCSIPRPLSIPPSPSFPALSTNSSFVTIGDISTQTHTFDLQLLSVSRNAPTRCIVFLLRLKSTTKEMFPKGNQKLSQELAEGSRRW